MAKTTTKTQDAPAPVHDQTQDQATTAPTASEAAAAAPRALQVRVQRLTQTATLPTYGSDGAACFDLHADTIPGAPLGTALPAGSSLDVGTGLAFEIPPGFCMRIYSRSGHGFKHGVRLANCVGVIDSDYRGEVRVKLTHDGHRDLPVRRGDRIAQAEICPVFRVEFDEAETLSDTDRGSNGFGSTGA
jgi:dUTP pyrophosphatase